MSSSRGGVLRLGIEFRCICTVFAHFEPLSLDSQSLFCILSDKGAYEMTLQSSDRSRSGSTPWETFGRLLGPQMTSR